MIIGTNIDLRPVDVNDAEFILSLRLNKDLNKYLSPVKNDIQKQRDWIVFSKDNKEEWYFIVQNKKQIPVGTIRIYDIQDDSFCWGSWIITPEARAYASFESIVLLYAFAFLELKYNKTHFDVRKENTKALNFYLKFGAIITNQNDIDFFMEYTKNDFLEHLDYYNNVVQNQKLKYAQ